MSIEGNIYKSLIHKYDTEQSNQKTYSNKALNENIKNINRNRKKIINEGSYISSSKDKLSELIDLLKEYGYILDDSVIPIKDNMMGGKHLQVINPDIVIESVNDNSEFVTYIDPIINALDKFDRELQDSKQGYLTYNFGINKDNVVTAGLDLRLISNESLNKKEGEKKMSESKHRGWDPDEHLQKVVKYYKDWAGFGEDEVLTEDLLKNEDWRLKRVSSLKNVPVKQLKAELLKQKDSE